MSMVFDPSNALLQRQTTHASHSQALQQNAFDTSIRWMLVTLLVFAPLAFGAVDAWSEEIVILLCAAMATTLAAKLVARRQDSFIWSWTYLPLALFVGIVALQIAPLPVSWVHCLSPQTLVIQNDHPFVSAAAMSTTTLSLYPAETWHEFRLLLCAATVFVISVNTLRSSTQIVHVLLAASAIGLVEALLNILQFVSGTHKVLWIVPMANPYSGTFAGHAHFGQFINLCCGAMLALALVRMAEVRDVARRPAIDGASLLFNREYRAIWLLLTCVAVSLCGMCLSMTRGGMVAAMISGIVTVGITAYQSRRFDRRRGRSQTAEGRGNFVILGILAGLLILLLTGFESVYDRLATLQNIQKSIDVRPQIARDLVQVFKSFPILGTGLGSHATVYPMYQTVLAPAMAYTADNEYLQMLEETGSAGIALILVFIGMLAFAYFKILFRRQKPIRAAGVGLGFGLLAVLVQSATDFGQQLPSLFCLTAMFSGILVVLATKTSKVVLAQTLQANLPGDPISNRSRKISTGLGFAVRAVCLPITLVVSILLLEPADQTRRAEACWNRALAYDQVARDANWQIGNDTYAGLISSTAEAVRLKPDDVRYAYWLAVYRWQSVARACEGSPDANLVRVRSQAACRVITNLLATTRLCPTYAAPYAAAAQIEYAALNQPALALGLMQKALQLGRSDPTILIAAAELFIHTGHVDESAKLLKTCITADDRYAPHAADLMLGQNRFDLAMNLAGDNIRQLMYLFSNLPKPAPRAENQPAQALTVCQTIVIKKLQTLCQQPDVDSGALALLGRISMVRNDPVSASRYFERALAKDYGQVDWRLDLARALVAIGQTDAAITEVRACHRLAPERADVKAYLEEISNPAHQNAVRSFG